MSASSDGSGIALDPVAVRDDHVRVTRELELRGNGLIVTHRISPTDDTPVKFRIEDTIASTFDIDDLGFHPAFEPSAGRITTEETVIEGIAEPGYAREIVWGICPTRPKPPEDVRRLHQSVQPTIATAERWAGVKHRHDETSRTETERSSERVPGTSVFAKLKRRLWGEPSAPPESGATESPAPSERVDSDLRREETLGHLDDVFMNLEAEEAETAISTNQSANTPGVDWVEFWGESTARAARTGRSAQPDGLINETEDSPEGPSERPAQGVVDGWPNLEFDSETITEADEGNRTLSGVFEGIEPAATDSNSNGTDSAGLDVATQLIYQLDDGWPLEKRRQLAERLFDESTQERLATAGLDDRVAALEAQIDEVSDFNEALAATIDTYGPAEEYLIQ